jgi:nucleotide-binding universal stress UspA family protein
MRVLLAVDGSAFSEAAVSSVVSTMRPAAVEILVLQVADVRAIRTPPSWSEPTSPLNDAKESVARAAQTLRAAGFTVTTRIAEGEVRSTILDVAAQEHADLIVLGSHGRTGLRRFALGSVAETVVRHAHCSVTIVRKTPPP